MGTGTWRVLCLGTLLLAAALPGFAATYYVATTGDDTAAGTEAAPVKTLMQAAALAKPGDTVLVKAGTYPGNMGIGCSGAEGQPITFKAAGDGAVKFLGRIEQVQGFKLVEGKQRTYAADVTGDVATVAADLDTTKLTLEGLLAVKSVEEVEAGGLRWYYDKEAGKLYVNYLNAPWEPDHTIHLLRDGSGINVGGSWLVLEGFTISSFGSNGISMGGGAT